MATPQLSDAAKLEAIATFLKWDGEHATDGEIIDQIWYVVFEGRLKYEA